MASRRCPVCGELIFLSLVEPTYQNGYDEASGGDQTSAGADTQNETVNDLEQDSSTKEETKAYESSELSQNRNR